MQLSFEVPGDPAPWTSWPKRGAPPMGFLRMQAWQEQIQAHARVAMKGNPPTGRLVNLDVVFYDPKCQGHDRTNLLKAFEDALQGIVYLNDRQVVGGKAYKVQGKKGMEGLTVVWITEGGEYAPPRRSLGTQSSGEQNP